MKNRPGRLRWRLAVPLTMAFFVLWAGTMALLTHAACRELEQTVELGYRTALTSLQWHWGDYEAALAAGRGTEAAPRVEYNLSSASDAMTDIAEGALAFLIRDETGNVLRSQLAYGDGLDWSRQWYMSFDGLDDQGQLELARWIVQHGDPAFRRYQLLPEDNPYVPAAEGEDQYDCIGTYARVTGVEQPGYIIDVQKIEIVYPDGNVELMVETDTQDGESAVWELPLITISSVLLPPWEGDHSGPVDMEQRLANFREAQAILDRLLAGEDRIIRTSGGRLEGQRDSDTNFLCVVAGQCEISAAAVEKQGFLYVSTFVLTVAVVFLLSAHLSKKVTGPVEELSRTVRSGRCREDGPVTELNTLAAAFNDAQVQLAGRLERERSFTRAAAHELKTPLAILRTHAEALREDIAPEKRERYLDVILDESDRMAELVGRLLELSRLESGTALHRETVDLAALVREVWAPMALQMEQKQVTLSLELEEVRTEGDPERLKEAVNNLASNALRHCERGGGIRVSLAQMNGQACVSVYNDGSSILAEDLPHLFEPFYRGEKSHNRSSGGTGLGLAIVRAVVLAHGGDCSAENQAGGVCFQIRLPLAGEDRSEV